jgi:anti-sigma28 factor (negative regulator of flagellin synthesis)
MRVTEQNTNGASAVEAGRAQEAKRLDGGAASQAAASKYGGDRVELSSTSASLSRTMAAHRSAADAKVQELAAQYQSGRYRADSAATSRGMVAEAMSPSVG